MTEFRIPEIGSSLSERIFKTAPGNNFETAGFYISSLPRFAAYWIGRAIKEINLAVPGIEKACAVDITTDSVAMTIFKRAGEVAGKVGLFLAGSATYFSFAAVSLVDLIGIAIRTLGLPGEEPTIQPKIVKRDTQNNDESINSSNKPLKPESVKEERPVILGSCTTITYSAPVAQSV